MQRFLSLLLVAFMVAPPALAGTFTIPNDFTNGTVADADEVDANFNAAKTAVDDNDLRIDALLATDTCTSPPCSLTNGTTLNGSPIVSTAKSGYFMASEYASGSSTGGIEEAINAACSAGSGVVKFTGDITTSATINLDCEGVILEGSSRLDTITFTAGTNGIVVSGDKTRLRNFTITPSASDASSTAIYLSDGTTSAAADVRIENLWIQGYAGGLGTGVYCRTCLRSGVFESSIIGWNHGIYLQDETITPPDPDEDIDPNSFAVVSSAIRSNTTAGIRIIDLTSTVSITGASTFENNSIGARCDSGTGTLFSSGTHWENTGTSNIYRQTGSGCAVVSIGDRMGGTTSSDYTKLSDGSSKDVFIGTYWKNGISNSTDSCVFVIAPANVFNVTPGDSVDLDYPQTCMMDIPQDGTAITFSNGLGLWDTDATDGDRSALIYTDCTTATSGSEDCDVVLAVQYDGSATPQPFLRLNADGGLEVTPPVGGTGTTMLVVPNGSISGDEIADDGVALSTKTTGNYVATIADSGASEVTVSGSGSEGAAVTLAIASTITRDSELRAFTVSASAASGSCTAGDLWLKTSATVTLYACTATDTWSTGVGI